MNKLVALLVLLLSLGSAQGVGADFYVTEISYETLQPDSVAQLNLTLKNLAPNYAVYTKVTFDPEDTSPVDPLGTSKKYVGKFREGKGGEYFGAILQNEEVSVGYEVYVKKGTQDGVYYVPMLIEWKDEKLNPKSQTVDLALLVRGRVKLGTANVVTSPTEIRSGEDGVKLKLSLSNTGSSEAKDVRAKLLLSGPFSPSSSGSDTAFLGNVAGDGKASAEFQFDVDEGAPARKYSLPLELSYSDPAGNSHTQMEKVEVLVEPRPYLKLVEWNTSPEEPSPGEKVHLKLKLENTGGEDAENTDLRVIRESSHPFEYEKRSDYIGTLEPGSTGEGLLELSVESSATPKQYRLRVSTRYTGDAEEGDTNVYTQELALPLKVSQLEEPLASKGKNLALIAIAAVAIAAIAAWTRRS